MDVTLTNESPYWLAAGWTMFHFLWMGAVVGTIAAAVRSTLSRTTPAIRYATALSSLLATAVLPGLLFLAAVDSIRESNVPSAESGRVGSVHVVSLLPGGTTALLERPLPEAKNAAPESATWLPAELVGLLCRWLPWLWISGSPTALLLLACGVIGAERLRRDARPLEEGELTATSRRLQAALGVSRRVVVAVSDRVAAPLLVGIVRPMILLPSAVLAGCSPEQLEMILLHELAHVRRWDNLVNLGQRLIEATLFFHPVIWWLSNWVRLEREQCCDSIVLAHTGSPQMYAETLAALALPGMDLYPAAVALTDAHLAVRIRHILKLEEETMTLSRKACLIGAAAVVVGGCLVAGILQMQKPAETQVTEYQHVIDQDVSKERLVRLNEASRAVKGPYKVAVPDILSIEVSNSAARNSLQVGDEVLIRETNLLPFDPQADPELNKLKQISGTIPVQPDGTVDLGPHYGSVVVEKMTIQEAKESITKHLRSEKVGLVDPLVSVSLPVVTATQVISGEYKILPDGTVWLGKYGSVDLDGKTLYEVKATLEAHLARFIAKPEVRIGVVAFHSR